MWKNKKYTKNHKTQSNLNDDINIYFILFLSIIFFDISLFKNKVNQTTNTQSILKRQIKLQKTENCSIVKYFNIIGWYT